MPKQIFKQTNNNLLIWDNLLAFVDKDEEAIEEFTAVLELMLLRKAGKKTH